MDTLINTCFQTTNSLRSIANYSHFLPLAIGVVLSGYIVFRKGFNFLSGSFFAFSVLFAIWLFGDLVNWTNNDYHLVSATWYFLDFTVTLIFISAVFFFDAFSGTEMSTKRKVFLLLLALPAFFISISGDAILGFTHSVCEAIENSQMTYYKIFVETIAIILIVQTLFRKKTEDQLKNKKSITIGGIGLILTLLVFALSEFVSSATGVYEISLFTLFIVPVYQFIVIFLTSKFNSFNLKNWNQQILAIVIILLVASQLFFTKNTVDFILNVFTLLGSTALVYFLNQNIKIEMADKARIEELAKSLIEKNKKLEELDMQKSEFISLASHQLRGPLTAIKGYASMIIEGDFGKIENNIKEAIETIFKSTQALVVIVGDYLDVSRIEQGKMKYDFTDFDLKNIAQTVVNEMTPTVEQAGLKLTFNIESGDDFVVRADEGKIKQVITNLVDNSLKYTKKGSIDILLKRDEKNNLTLCIKDTGIGISKDVLPKLFERFSRAPDASKTNILGTGLGLYVARKIVEAHRGKIWAESEGEGKGSKFSFELEALNNDKRPKFKDAFPEK